MSGSQVRLQFGFVFKLLFTITKFTIMTNKLQEHCLTHSNTLILLLLSLQNKLVTVAF